MKKKILSILLIVVLVVGLTGCGSKTEKVKNKSSEDKEVLKSDNLKIDGVYVDDSYKDKDNDSLKLVYVFTTVTPTKKNLKVSSVYKKMKIGENEYDSDLFLDAMSRSFLSSYYNSRYVKDLYVGDSLKVLLTFKIPNGDLAKGKKVTFSYADEGIDVSKIMLKTDNFKHKNGIEEIAKETDPEGYNKELDNRSDADGATANRVKQSINDYEYSFYVNNSYYTLTFSAPNNFDITMGSLDNSGIYSVKKAYIALSYDNGATTKVLIPYSFKDNGEIDLDTVKAFDVR